MAKSVPSSHLRLPRNPKGANAATLQRIASALAEIQAILCNRSRPRCSRSTNSTGARGDRGEALFCFPPAALRAWVDDPSTRESGLTAVHQSNLQKNTNKLDKSNICWCAVTHISGNHRFDFA